MGRHVEVQGCGDEAYLEQWKKLIQNLCERSRTKDGNRSVLIVNVLETGFIFVADGTRILKRHNATLVLAPRPRLRKGTGLHIAARI